MDSKYQGNINDLTHKIIGCAMRVHNHLGNGFQEIIYQRALAIELRNANLIFECEKEMPIIYCGELIGSRRVDIFVENCVMVELKAFDAIQDVHKNQAINYLEVYNIADGSLINFGALSLEFKRVYNKKLVNPGDNPNKIRSSKNYPVNLTDHYIVSWPINISIITANKVPAKS